MGRGMVEQEKLLGESMTEDTSSLIYAEYLNFSSDLIYRLAQQGKIPVSKIGSRWRFQREKVDRWMEEQDTSGARGS